MNNLNPKESESIYPFLEGGGEMGALTRAYNWGNNPLGKPDTWPISLRTTVAMILSSKFPMFLWWGDDLIQFYNDAYRPSLGNDGKHPTALGQTAEACWPEIWDIIHPLIQQVRTTGNATWSEDQLIPISRNGQLEDVYWTFGYSAVRNEFGQIQGVLVVCNETTEKIVNQRKLVQSEQRLRTILITAPVGIGLFVGRDLIIEMPNQSFIDIVGKGTQIEGKPLREVMPELVTENQPYLQILDDVYTTGVEFKTYGSQVRIMRNGVLHNNYYNFTYTPLFDGNGEVYAILDIAIDVTEQVIAKQMLAQSEENLRNTILKAPVAMCIFKGPEFVVEIANHRMFEFWGKTAEDVINKPIFEGLPEAKDQGFEELLKQVYNTGEAFVAESVPVSLPRNNNIEVVYVNFVYEAYYDGEGMITGIIAVANEVTNQVLAQRKIEEKVTERTKELAAANLELQRSNAELAQFAYIASHDLQEPLRKVSTFTQMLEQALAGRLNEKETNYINKINASTARMTALIRDVLAYSQLSKENDSFKKVDLQETVSHIVSDYDLLIEQKKAHINFENLSTVEAIPLHMSQLFGNLISNALKFTNPDKAPLINISASIVDRDDIAVSSLPHTRYHKITVTDNGIGFENVHATQIFNIFQRLHGKSAYTGTGIGLAMCKKIAQNHHGEIYATSSPGGGATFTMLLPVEQPLNPRAQGLN